MDAVPLTSDTNWVDGVFYPDSDGKPMAENEPQGDAIRLLHLGFSLLYAEDHDVHVACDLLWYPVKGDPTVCTAPDVYVIRGLDKRMLNSFKPFVQGGRVVIAVEVLSPSNTAAEMAGKRAFYDRHGVDEYVQFDPRSAELRVWERGADGLLEVPVHADDGWRSPSSGVRLWVADAALRAAAPDGRPFLRPLEEAQRAAREADRASRESLRAAAQHARARELAELAEQESARAEQESARAKQESARAKQESARAEEAAARAEGLAAENARLRALLAERGRGG